MCECIEKVNAKLAEKHISLKMRTTIDMETFEPGKALALETVSLKKGVKAKPIFMAFCPFCGKKNE